MLHVERQLGKLRQDEHASAQLHSCALAERKGRQPTVDKNDSATIRARALSDNLASEISLSTAEGVPESQSG